MFFMQVLQVDFLADFQFTQVYTGLPMNIYFLASKIFKFLKFLTKFLKFLNS